MDETAELGPHRLVRKLERLGPLTDAARRAVQAVPLHVQPVDAGRELVRAGERPTHGLLLLDGFACRHKPLEDGRRQIVSLHIPGDIVALDGLVLGRLDHTVATLTPVRVAPLAHASVRDWMRRHPDLGDALWRDTLSEAAIWREWVVNLGRRTASQRVAHLLCELVTRLRAAGLARGHMCELPLTQAELADATALSAVHVNRVVQELRAEGLIEIGNGKLVVRDWAGLTWAGGFDPAYLYPLAAA